MSKLKFINKSFQNLNNNSPKGFNIIESISKPSIRYLGVDDIQREEPFISLFAINTEVLNSITESMKEKGFDIATPLIIWKERNILVDGHTRLQAAKNAGLDKVPVVYASFKNEESVLNYMYNIQFNRRNITDKEIINLVRKVLPEYEKKYGEGSKSAFLSKKFTGLSESKAKKIVLVIERASDKQLQDIEEDNETISNVYNKLLKEKKSKIEETQAQFFDDDMGSIIRYDENGNFYYRNHTNKKEIKAFTLPKYLNTENIKKGIAMVLEENK